MNNLNLKLNLNIKRPIEFANGKKYLTKGYMKNLSFFWSGQEYTRNLLMVDMGEHDVTICMDWKINNHAFIGYEERKLTFKHTNGSNHTIHGEERDYKKSLIILAINFWGVLNKGMKPFLDKM